MCPRINQCMKTKNLLIYLSVHNIYEMYLLFITSISIYNNNLFRSYSFQEEWMNGWWRMADTRKCLMTQVLRKLSPPPPLPLPLPLPLHYLITITAAEGVNTHFGRIIKPWIEAAVTNEQCKFWFFTKVLN